MSRVRFAGILGLGVSLCVLPRAARGQAKSLPRGDADCLACHGQTDLKSANGRSVYVDAAKHGASVHAALGCTTCHADIHGYPHPAPPAKVQCATCHAAEAGQLGKGVHGALGPNACASCHGSAHYAQPAASLAPKACAACHADEVNHYLSSIHGRAERTGDHEAPDCSSCHGAAHGIVTSEDPHSPVAKHNQPATCGACHSNSEFLRKHQIPFADPVGTYLRSVHGRAVAAGNVNAASCADCHSAHAILPPSASGSKISRWKVPETCGTCHQDVEKSYLESVHGQAVLHGSADAPVCTDCHGDHTILSPGEAASAVNPAHVSTETCGRCHGDTRLAGRYNLPADRVPTFADSYHGLAGAEGSQTVANCASCHGVHDIFAASDPRSTVNPANLARTCGKCHAGAGKYFAIGPVHVTPASTAEAPAVRVIRWIYLILIPATLGFMLLHNLLDFGRKLLRRRFPPRTGEAVPRMNLHFRVAHWLTVISFPVLVMTGFALKFPGAWWAQPLLQWEAHVSVRGRIHRVAAIVLLASLAYHVVHLALVRRDRKCIRAMLPRWSDLRDLRDVLLYNLGLREDAPALGKFSYGEKIEYLAFLWGTVIMAASGFLLWFTDFTLHFFPKWMLDAATAVHYYEAILATLSILVWHFYAVIFDPDVYPMDFSWLTGKASADHLRHTRPEYYAELVKSEEPATREPASREDSPGRPPEAPKGK